MGNSTVRLGIIGLGAIGNRMINGFQKNETIEIAAICDVNVELLQKTKEDLGGNVTTYSDYKILLSEERLDLVYVAVPPAYHEQIALDIMAKGIHILCEKPLANSAAETKRMADAAKKAGIINAINFPLNYQQAIVKFSSLINEGYIGELRRINLVMHFSEWPRPWQKNSWVGKREQGGYIMEVGAHWVQAIQKFFGEISNVESELQFPADPEACETGVLAKMRLGDGTPILVDGLSQIAGEENLQFLVVGTEGTLIIENWGILKGGKLGEPIQELNLVEVQTETIIDNLVRAIKGDQAELYDFQVGHEVQVVLEALRGSDMKTPK